MRAETCCHPHVNMLSGCTSLSLRLNGAGGFQVPLKPESGLSGSSEVLHTCLKWDFLQWDPPSPIVMCCPNGVKL